MNSDTTTVDDDLEDEAPTRPMRRDGRLIAMPAEPIPAEINSAFLEDLAFERALSLASALVSSPASARWAVPGRVHPSELDSAVLAASPAI